MNQKWLSTSDLLLYCIDGSVMLWGSVQKNTYVLSSAICYSTLLFWEPHSHIYVLESEQCNYTDRNTSFENCVAVLISESRLWILPFSVFFHQKKGIKICTVLENAQFRSQSVTFFFLRKAIHYLMKLILAITFLSSF